MIEADKIYLGKVFVDYSDAIETSQKELDETEAIMKAIIEGLGLSDMRQNETTMYQYRLKQVVMYAETKGISLEALIKLGEDFKKVSFGDFMTLKTQVTIKEELDELLN